MHIKYISQTEEGELMKRFKTDLYTILSSDVENKNAGINKIKKEYAKLLIQIRRRDMQNDDSRSILLKKLERNITALFHLILNWVQYVEIIYMSEVGVQNLRHMRLNTDNDNESSEKDYEKQNKEYMEKVLSKQDKSKEDTIYQTVEEGVTTDTAEEHESVEEENSSEKQHQSEQSDQDEEDDVDFGEDGGILGQLMAEENAKEEADNQIQSFQADENFETMSKSENDENFYGFGNFEVENFRARLQSKGNIKSEEQESEQQEINSNLDMYGIIDEYVDSTRSNQERMLRQQREQFIADQLADLAETLDNEFITEMDKAAPTSGIDPYNPPKDLTYFLLNKQENEKSNASLVLNVFYEKLDQMSTEGLTKSETETVEKLKNLLDYMSQIRIVDSKVLAQIYDKYRFKI